MPEKDATCAYAQIKSDHNLIKTVLPASDPDWPQKTRSANLWKYAMHTLSASKIADE